MSGMEPQSVLFMCTLNAVRSPIAEGLARRALGRGIFVASAGIVKAPADHFAISVMHEIGIDISEHCSRTVEETDCASFDLIVALSREAAAAARARTRGCATEVEAWDVPEISGAGETRSQKLEAYRGLRDSLGHRIEARFAARLGAPGNVRR